jgi:threonine dehydrogenase-like Zn-dependent dehydrogenase
VPADAKSLPIGQRPIGFLSAGPVVRLRGRSESVRSTRVSIQGKAAVLRAPGRFDIIEHSPRDPGPGEVLLRLSGCGVCASNVPPWEGREWFRYPLPPGNPGHEAWGVVEKIGPGVRTLQPGQTVAALGDAAYASWLVTRAEHTVVLPAGLASQPFPGEPLACAFNVFRRCAIAPGQRVAIIGIGFMGAVLTKLARDVGAEVIAISRRTSSLETAAAMGAHATVRMDDHQRIIEQVQQLTGEVLCDCVIECVGSQWPLDLASALVRVRGRLVIAGYHQDGARQVDMQSWNWRGLDVINAHERAPETYVQGMRDAIDAVLAGRLDPRPLYTHSFPLEGIAEAMELTRKRPEGFVKALLRYD